jgi:hypothetical protein
MKSHLFQINIEALNRRSGVERSLDDFLNACLAKNVRIDSFYEATRELLTRYLSVVRSRNKIRRNWHPETAQACDVEALQWISKDKFRNSLDKRLRKALVIATDGNRVIEEESIQQLVDETVNEVYKKNRKKSKPSTLEEIVRTIHKSNPDVTDTEVVKEMRSTPEKFGIVEIDDTHVVIQVPSGVGKQTVYKSRSHSTIKNILGRINNPK